MMVVMSSNAGDTFTANNNRTLVAVFAEKATPGVSANPTEGGTVSGGRTCQQDKSVTVTATAKTGYIFVHWTKKENQIHCLSFRDIHHGSGIQIPIGGMSSQIFIVSLTANHSRIVAA